MGSCTTCSWVLYGGRAGPHRFEVPVWKQTEAGHTSQLCPAPSHIPTCTKTYNAVQICSSISTSANKLKMGRPALGSTAGLPNSFGDLCELFVIGFVAAASLSSLLKKRGKMALRRACPLGPSRRRVLGIARQPICTHINKMRSPLGKLLAALRKPL